MELADVVGEPPELADQAGEEGSPQVRVLVDEAVEGVAAEDEGLGRLERDRGRRVLLAVEQGELAEEVAGIEGGDDRALLALGIGKHDLHGAALDDVQRVAGITLVEDRLVPPVAPVAQRFGAAHQGLVVDPREEDAVPQRLHGNRPLVRGHWFLPSRSPGRPTAECYGAGPVVATREIGPSRRDRRERAPRPLSSARVLEP